MVSIGEGERIKGYYAALGGLRYTMGIIDDPVSYGITLPTTGNKSTYPATLPAFGALTTAGLGISGSENLVIDIKNNGDGTYTVSARYNY